jgi:biopolymer transport protein ExbD
MSEESGKGYEIDVMMVMIIMMVIDMILMTTEMTIKDKETKSNCFTILLQETAEMTTESEPPSNCQFSFERVKSEASPGALD